MSIQVQKHLISVNDFHRMGEAGILPEQGVELINGEIYEMSPIGSKHASVVDRINNLLSRQLGDEVILRVQNPVVLSDFSEPEPDIAIVKFKEDFYETAHPCAEDILLIIEVCDSSIVYDRQIKLPLYAQNAVPECWLIDLEKKEIQAYWQPFGEIYRFSQIGLKGDVLKARNVNLELPIKKIFG